MLESRRSTGSTAGIVAAFLAIYLIWGSTYLGIRIAIETLPPLLMAGLRFLIAGALLYGWARLRGAPRPAAAHWRSAFVVGALLFLFGNGGVVWAEQWVDSGLAALMIATEPLCIVLLAWLAPGGTRPGARVIAGLFIGFAGVALLVGGGTGPGGLDLAGAAILVLAALCWAAGSIYSPRAPFPSSQILSTAMTMLGGGALLTLAGLLHGEAARVTEAALSLRSVLAFGYLVVFGSIVGFSAYRWLLEVTTPTRVSTYAYVNPAVAVLLGWALAGEKVGAQTLLAGGIIVLAVVLIVTDGKSLGARRDARRSRRNGTSRATSAAA